MRALIAIVTLLLFLPGMANAGYIVINNGLAPPNAGNVIDDDAYLSDWVLSRNAGCPPGTPR